MSALSQAWFTLFEAAPLSLSVLKHSLTPAEFRRALARVVWRSLFSKPMRALPKAQDEKDRFTRRQLEPVLVLQDALEQDLGLPKARSLEILEKVVSQSGARFIEKTIELPERASWERMDQAQRDGLVERIMARFENAQTRMVRAPTAEVAFDVQMCHFVRLTKALGRTELAPFFCKADSVYFQRPGLPVLLDRKRTIASGDAECDFRFRFKDPSL